MRFRPRFSVRTLAIVVTLVCAYFGAWEATKRYGVRSLGIYRNGEMLAYAPIPFVVCCDEHVTPPSYYRDASFQPRRVFLGKGRIVKQYHLWLFGPKFKLPFESEWKEF